MRARLVGEAEEASLSDSPSRPRLVPRLLSPLASAAGASDSLGSWPYSLRRQGQHKSAHRQSTITHTSWERSERPWDSAGPCGRG